ncbi:hypothetical protein Taro_043980 [Colocasia esculenta]|uniref:FLZ-type domain-containing protein n=1 Tax=Colocasia esculenta TaxID=4460 RepID=A0A843WTE1_COLES|nr:hypothetical protein [Colocasia esculenta]
MYRGYTPFCIEECRREQIELDEARERETRYRHRRHRHHRAASLGYPASSSSAMAAKAVIAT